MCELPLNHPPSIHPDTSLMYAKSFYTAKMTTIERLAKKIGKGSGYLLSLGVEEEDASLALRGLASPVGVSLGGSGGGGCPLKEGPSPTTPISFPPPITNFSSPFAAAWNLLHDPVRARDPSLAPLSKCIHEELGLTGPVSHSLPSYRPCDNSTTKHHSTILSLTVCMSYPPSQYLK